jgi:hypothetical protein
MALVARTGTIDIAPDDISQDDLDPSTAEAIFKTAVTDFKASLSQADRDNYSGKTIKHIKLKIMAIQQRQERSNAMMNFSRIQFYLERFAEFDDVCKHAKIGGDASSELSSLIWGPSTHILQVCLES